MSHRKLATWAELNLAKGFAVFNSPDAHRVQMRTTNGLERLNKELKRRTRVATLLPNPATCLRLVNVLLGEQDEKWVTAKNPPEHQTQIRRYLSLVSELAVRYDKGDGVSRDVNEALSLFWKVTGLGNCGV